LAFSACAERRPSVQASACFLPSPLVSIYPIFCSSAYQTTVIPARSDTFTVTMPGSGLPLRFAARRCRSIRLQPRFASRALVVPRERDLEREDEDVKDKARFTRDSGGARRGSCIAIELDRISASIISAAHPPALLALPRVALFGHFHFTGRGLSLKRVVGCRGSHRDRNFLFRRLRNGRVSPDRSYSI